MIAVSKLAALRLARAHSPCVLKDGHLTAIRQTSISFHFPPRDHAVLQTTDDFKIQLRALM
jgi:hypothetical protein